MTTAPLIHDLIHNYLGINGVVLRHEALAALADDLLNDRLISSDFGCDEAELLRSIGALIAEIQGGTPK